MTEHSHDADIELDAAELKARTDRLRIAWAGDTAEATGRARKKLREQAREWTALGLSTLVDVMLTGSDAARVAAVREIFDRGYGKAKEIVEVEDKREAATVDMVREAVRQLAKDPEARVMLRAVARGGN